MTAGDAIKRALRLLGAYDSNSTPTANELADGLTALNAMLLAWSTKRNGVYTVTDETFPMVASQASYTIGSGADIDTARPTRILEAYARVGTTDYPLRQITRTEYAELSDKATEADIPTEFYYEPGYPAGTITLYPVPSSVATVHIQSWKPLGQYPATSDDLGLPPEYESAIVYNLAADIAPEYRIEPSAVVAARAVEYYKDLRGLHAQPVPKLKMPFTGSTFNIYRGY